MLSSAPVMASYPLHLPAAVGSFIAMVTKLLKKTKFWDDRNVKELAGSSWDPFNQTYIQQEYNWQNG